MIHTLLYGSQVPLSAQESNPTPDKPKFQVQLVNSCRPAQLDLEEMGRALARVKDSPVFSPDFEIARGVTTLTEEEAQATGAPATTGNIPSAWVRIRRDFPDKAVLTSAQYSLSVDGNSTSEVLALHMREGKDVLQILISDSVIGTPAQVLKSDTPPERIRIERFGKASLMLTRCGGVDQSAYEPTFAVANAILQKYREAMAVKSVVPSELARLPGSKESKTAAGNHK